MFSSDISKRIYSVCLLLLFGGILLIGAFAGRTEQFQVFVDMLETEEPYLEQSELEAQVQKRANIIFYLLKEEHYYEESWAGESFDYIVLHQPYRDQEDEYHIRLILQPKNETLRTREIALYVYQQGKYFSIDRPGIEPERIDFSSIESIKRTDESFLASLDMQDERSPYYQTTNRKVYLPRIWYKGTICFRDDEKPVYEEFEEKDKLVAQIKEWTVDWFSYYEMEIDSEKIRIENFNEDDAGTNIIVETVEDGAVTYYEVPYYFDTENNFQKIEKIELEDENPLKEYIE